MKIFEKLFGPPNVNKLIEKKDVKGLIKAIHDSSRTDEEKEAAIKALGVIGDPIAIEPLIDVLTNKKSIDATIALGKIYDPRTINPLIKALKYKNHLVREQAAKALGSRPDPKAINALIRALKDKNPLVREQAEEALENECRICQVTILVVEPLIKALKDQDERVREIAIGLLGMTENVSTIEPLTQALNDEVESVRTQAARVLGKKYFRLGTKCDNSNDLEGAINNYSKAITLEIHPKAYYYRACVYKDQGKYKKAIDDFKNYLKYGPSSSEEVMASKITIKELEMKISTISSIKGQRSNIPCPQCKNNLIITERNVDGVVGVMKLQCASCGQTVIKA